MLGNLGGCCCGCLEQDLLDFGMERELLERLETFQKLIKAKCRLLLRFATVVIENLQGLIQTTPDGGI
ncbi:MAG: hypothetical protein GDA42_09720 [Ekhidna sp.]|nr:hypothetical protein [Ekhidna sp.]MBC6410716.1 hypothetical protein [Ekhidna sp.]